MRNFNIYIFKTKKKLEDVSIVEQANADVVSERETVHTELKRFVKKLKSAGEGEAYDGAFKRGIDKIAKLYNFPEEKLGCIGYEVAYPNGNKQVIITPVSVETVENKIKSILPITFNKIEGDLENMDFVYQLWRQKFIDGNGTIWLSKEDLDEGINLADKTIGNSYHPEEYLPQEDGEYDKAYFKSVRQFRNTCKHLLRLMDKKYKIYAIILQKA